MTDKAIQAINRYFWDGQKIIPVDGYVHPRELALQFHNMPCVAIEPKERPRFVKYNFAGWKTLPKDCIPKQLRLLALINT